MERTTFTYGGNGGSPFPASSPHSVGLRTGDLVDAIIINGQHYGGDGGGNPTIQTLGPDEYWSAFSVRSGSLIDHLKLTSSSGRTVEGGGGGGNPDSHDSLRIVSIGGRSGASVDSLSLDVVIDYKPSTTKAWNVEVILDVRTGGQTISNFNDVTVRTAHSYQLVTQKMQEWSVNASAEGEYFAKFSASTSFKTSDSSTQSIQDESSQVVQSGSSTTQTIGPDQAAFLIGRMDLLTDSDGHAWMSPTSEANWVVLGRGDFGTLVGKYDVTGGAATQAGLADEKDATTGFYKLKKP
jgi:hypothetical protein